MAEPDLQKRAITLCGMAPSTLRMLAARRACICLFDTLFALKLQLISVAGLLLSQRSSMNQPTSQLAKVKRDFERIVTDQPINGGEIMPCSGVCVRA